MLLESISAFPWILISNCCVQIFVLCSFCWFFKPSHPKWLMLVDQLGQTNQPRVRSSLSCISEWQGIFLFSFLQSRQERYLCSSNPCLPLFPWMHRAFPWLEVQAGLGCAGIPASQKLLHDLFRQTIFPGQLHTSPQGSQEIALGSGESWLGEKESNFE